MATDERKNIETHPQEPQSNGRRNLIKTLASIPVLGALGLGVYAKTKYDTEARSLGTNFTFNSRPPVPAVMEGKQIRIGLIGFGIRGKQLMRGLGFAEPQYLQTLIEAAKTDKKDSRYQQFCQQDDLNISITAVCDIFDIYGDDAILAGANVEREGLSGKFGAAPKRYRNYLQLIAADDVDAVVIATPDQWHSTMAIAAAAAGKHVYVEKPLSWTVPETYRVREAVKQSGVVFQLGHQGRQTDSYVRAKEIIDRGILGKISLIEVCTNRNDPNGAWVYPIIDGASPQSIDWKQFDGPEECIKEYIDYMTTNKLERFLGPEPRDQFSLERFFRWRCWWDYSTGLSGDLLTHEYDAINQIMGVGIPHSASSSGGVYFFKDGRTVPDVLQTTFEFPDKDLTMLYSATLASNRPRGKVIMGHDAQMEVSNTLIVKADQASTQYKDKISKGIIKPDEPFYTYIPGQNDVDAITSATELYFAQRGLLYTYVDGKRYDTTHLHLREWIHSIRTGSKPSCDIDSAFEEAMAAHMGTRAYLEGRTKYWDKDKEEIV
ncbi:hypothetical protein AwDysgo_05410 [Bacteroidales bacterium]|nr:hypothetical protein AwDysgo_05410 [Bacteroidales bacterium]